MPGAHSRRAVPENRRHSPYNKEGNSATRGSKKQKKGISGCSAVGARSRAPPAAETARRKCWAAMRAMQGRAKAAAARHMATGSAPRAVVKNRRKEYRGVAQLVARHIWDVDAVGSNPATPTMRSVLIGSEYPTKDTPHFLLPKLGQRRFHRTAADPGCTGALPCAG